MKLKNLLAVLAALSGFFIAQNVHATCSNPASYVDGQTLTAASLNSNIGAIATCVDNVLNGDTFTGNITLDAGSDLTINSGTGTPTKASIDGATGATIAGLTQAGQLTNCGISVSGSTFTIVGYDGTDLSATNPCVVAVKSNTAGRVALAYFTSNVTFTFGAASDTDGNLFGITDADWSSTMPFFIGVIYDGTTPYFTISRVPSYVSGAAATNLCQKGDTDCDAQVDTMILTTGLTLSSFVNLPITQVGWFRMTYATSGGAWTATTAINTGFNQEYENNVFTFPTGQNGAASGKYIRDNGGTAPRFSSSFYSYKIDHTGMFTGIINFSTVDINGAGAVLLKIASPYTPLIDASSYPASIGWGGANSNVGLITAQVTSGVYMLRNTSATAYTTVLNSDFNNAADFIVAHFTGYTIQ